MTDKDRIVLSKNIIYLVGSEDVIQESAKTPALPVFSDLIVRFLSELSKEILGIKGIREHTDVMSYAYWIRRASLERAEETVYDKEMRIGRGVAFHIAPSNVPVNFAVSMTSSLLAGNITIVRVSNKEFEEVDIICSSIKKVLEKEEFTKLKHYICIIRYDHSDEITAYLSSICDVRIIWGGNRTIEQIRKYPIPPRAIEMCFADRHSIAVIQPDEYLYYISEKDADGKIKKENGENVIDTDKLIEVARKFYTDTYYSDQNACSSPRIVVWLRDGRLNDESYEAVRSLFWAVLAKMVYQRYDMQPIQGIDKYSRFTELAMKKDDVRLYDFKNCFLPEDLKYANNKLVVVDVDSLDVVSIGENPDGLVKTDGTTRSKKIEIDKSVNHETIMDYKMSGGYFFQYTAESLDDIIPIMGKMCQTIAVLGIDKKEVVDFVMNTGVRGVDRVVDIGDTMGLEFTWDGFKMIEQMSRVMYIYIKSRSFSKKDEFGDLQGVCRL